MNSIFVMIGSMLAGRYSLQANLQYEFDNHHDWIPLTFDIWNYIWIFPKLI